MTAPALQTKAVLRSRCRFRISLDAVLRRMRFPYLRKAAPDVLATARAQRWDPADVVRILLEEEEIRGRDDSGRASR